MPQGRLFGRDRNGRRGGVNPYKKLFKPFTILFLALSSLCASAEDISVNSVDNYLSSGKNAQANTRGSVVNGKDSLTSGSYSNPITGQSAEIAENGSVDDGVSVQSPTALGVSLLASGEGSTDIGSSPEATEGGIAPLADEPVVNYDPVKKNLSVGPETIIPEKTTTPDGSQEDTANAVAIGSDGTTAALNSVAIGKQARAEAQGTIAVGRDARAQGAYSIAVGRESRANQDSAIAIGKEAWATKQGTVALGTEAHSTEDRSVAVGDGALSSGVQSVAVGPASQSLSADSVAFGSSSKAEGIESTALGASSWAIGKESLAVGNGAEAHMNSDSAVGHNAHADGGAAAAFGFEAHADASKAIAIGNAAYADKENASAMGAGAHATAEEAMALGTKSESTAESALAIGADAKAPAESSIVIGKKASAEEGANFGVALGLNSSVTTEGGVALGADSTANTDKGAFGYDPRTGLPYELPEGIKEDPIWQSSAAAVSVGGIGKNGKQITRQITNVAAGTNDTDAVNVAQLKAAQHHYYSVKSEIQGEGSNYLNDGATGENALAAGVGASATGDRGISVGLYSKADGANSIAIGSASEVEITENEDGTQTITGTGSPVAAGQNAIAIGTNVQATADNATAVGFGTLATGVGSSAYGFGANATANNSTALGANALATYESGTAVGSSAKVQNGASYSTALGYNTIVEGGATYSTAIGGAHVTESASYSLAAGANAVVGGGSSNSVVIGSSSSNSDSYRSRIYSSSNSTVIGSGSQATYGSSYSTVIGFQSKSTNSGQYGTIIGFQALADSGSEYATAIGFQPKIYSADYGTAIGYQAEVSYGADLSTAIGYQAKATNSSYQSTAIGYSALVSSGGYYGTAIGYDSEVYSASHGTAIGYQAQVSYGADQSTAIGYQALASNSSDYATAVGYQAKVTYSGSYGTAIGYSSIVQNSAYYGTAIGYSSIVQNSSNYGTAIGGSEVTEGGNYSIGIGRNSIVHNGSEYAVVIGGYSSSDSSARSRAYNSDYSTVIGSGAQAYNAQYGTAVGYHSRTDSVTNGTAVGFMSEVSYSANQSTAIGFQSKVTNSSIESTAIGFQSIVSNSSYYGTAIGYQSAVNSGTDYSTAIGYQSEATYGADNSTVIGYQSEATNGATNSTVIGFQSDATNSATNSTVVGFQSEATNSATNSTVIGFQSEASSSASNSTVVGFLSQATNGATNSTVIGNMALATNGSTNGTILGYQSKITNQSLYSTAIGGAEISGYEDDDTDTTAVENNIAIGRNSKIQNHSDNAIVIGSSAADTTEEEITRASYSDFASVIGSGSRSLSANYGTVVGFQSEVSNGANNSTVIGYQSSATNGSVDSTVVGYKSLATNGAQYGTVVGYNAELSGSADYATAVGSQAKVMNSADYGTALGHLSTVTNGSAYATAIGGATATDGSSYAIAMGQGAIVTAAPQAIVMGQGASATKEDTIVLGSYSKSGSAAGILGYDPIDPEHLDPKWEELQNSPTWVATNNAVSFGRAAEYDEDGNETLSAITRQINNVAAGTLDTDAVNVAQLKQATGDLRLNFSAEDFVAPVENEDGTLTPAKNVVAKTSGGRLPIIGDGEIVEKEQVGEDGLPVTDEEGNPIKFKERQAGNINTRVTEDIDGTQAIQITLADNLKLGGPGKDGKDGVDGSIGVAGADGKDGVTIKAEGGQGHIVINGKDGEPGEDGTPGEPGPKADITVVQGPAGVNGRDGETLTRIEYIDPDNPDDTPHQVATLEDGLKYKGNYGEAAVTLNNVTEIVGGASNPLTEEDKAKFVDDNLAVFAEQDGDNAKLVLRMNKNLSLPDGSITIAPPETPPEGTTPKTDIVIAQNNVTMGGNTITNVASGTENRPWNEDDPGYDETWNNAANIGDLNQVKKAHTAVTVGGGVKAAEEEGVYAKGGNLLLRVDTDPVTEQKTYDLKLDDKIMLGGAGADGKDGVDGSVGVAGADGKDGVTIKAEGGQGHIVINGKDGEPGEDGTPGEPGPKADITIVQGPAGVNGKDGETLTRIEYIDPDNPDDTPHQVATLEDGLKYKGNFGEAAVTLNNVTEIVGGATNPLTEEDKAKFVDDNLAVFAEQDGDNAKLVLRMNKNLTLPDGSLTITAPENTPEGTTPKTDIVIAQNNVTMGGNTITNVASGTENRPWNEDDPGYDETWNNAANIGDLNQVKKAHTAVTVGGGVKAAEEEGVYAKGGNLLLRVDTDPVTEQKTYDLKLDDKIMLGGAGADGKDGIDGSVGVAGADGKDGVTIKAEGGQGHIVINGKDGEPGEDGTPGEPGPKADITVVQGPAGVNGKDGETLTRIEYIDPDNPDDTPHQVATLEDGLKYKGNYGDATVTLNNVTEIVGGATNPLTEEDKAKFVDDNLAVFAEQDGDNAKLVLRMNKNLTLPDGSLTITAPENTPEGTTPKTDIVIAQNNVTMGGNTITNVASGTENRLWNEEDPGYDENWNNAANIGDLNQLKQKVTGAHTAVTVGGGVKAAEEDGVYAKGGNLLLRVDTDPVTEQKTYDLKLDDKIMLGGAGADGKDGVDGSMGVAGADGKDGVVIKAEGGQGHIVINGKDGEPGADGTPGEPGPKADITVVQGPAGVNGKDGETLTRIEYVDPDNPDDTPHQIATLEDGLKYKGNFGEAAVTLNNVTEIVGGASKPLTEEDKEKFVDDNLAVFAEQDGDNAKLVLRMNKNLTLPNGSITIAPPDGSDKTPIVISQDKISMGGNQITNVASGTKKRPWNDEDPGYDENWNNAANIGDLNQLKQKVTGAHTAVTVGGGVKAAEEEGEYAEGGNLLLNVQTNPDTEQKTYDLKLADNIRLGGADGKNGVDGSMGVAGADGKDGVSIMAEGGQGHIVIYGKDGAPGLDGKPGTGPAANITIVQGPAGVNGKDGDTLTRIEYIDPNDPTKTPHQVATLDDGIKYKGDLGNASVRLNKWTEIVGSTTHPLKEADKGNYVDDNLAVFAEQNGEDARLVLKMNKHLNLADGSITIKGNRDYKDIVIQQGDVSFGGNRIQNVAPGVDPTDAVNVSQLQNYVENSTVEHTFHAETVSRPELTGGAVLANNDHLNIFGDNKFITTSVDPDSKTIRVHFKGDLGTLPEYTGYHYISINSPHAPDLLNPPGNYNNNGADGAENAIAIGADASASVAGGVAIGYASVSNTKSGIKGYVIDGFTNEPATKVDESPTWKSTAGAFSVGGGKIQNEDGTYSVVTRQITNVAAGTALTDAVNVAQLKLLKDYVDDRVINSGSAGGGSGGMAYGADEGDDVALAANEKLAILGDNKNISTKIEAGSEGKPASVYVKLKDDIKVNTVSVGGNVNIDKYGFTIGATGPNQIQITEGNISMGGHQIHNVAPGTAGTDAVNLDQLNASNRQIFNKINDVDKNARAGIAQAIATAGLPQAYLPGKSMMAAAAGAYDGQAGIAIGISSISDDGKWVFKGSASGNSQGKFGGSLGIGYLF